MLRTPHPRGLVIGVVRIGIVFGRFGPVSVFSVSARDASAPSQRKRHPPPRRAAVRGEAQAYSQDRVVLRIRKQLASRPADGLHAQNAHGGHGRARHARARVRVVFVGPTFRAIRREAERIGARRRARRVGGLCHLRRAGTVGSVPEPGARSRALHRGRGFRERKRSDARVRVRRRRLRLSPRGGGGGGASARRYHRRLRVVAFFFVRLAPVEAQVLEVPVLLLVLGRGRTLERGPGRVVGVVGVRGVAEPDLRGAGLAAAGADAAGGPCGVADQVQAVQPGVQPRVRRQIPNRRGTVLLRSRQPERPRGRGRRGSRAQGNARGGVERRGRRVYARRRVSRRRRRLCLVARRRGVVGSRALFFFASLGIDRHLNKTAPPRVPLEPIPPRGRAQRPQRVPRYASSPFPGVVVFDGGDFFFRERGGERRLRFRFVHDVVRRLVASIPRREERAKVLRPVRAYFQRNAADDRRARRRVARVAVEDRLVHRLGDAERRRRRAQSGDRGGRDASTEREESVLEKALRRGNAF